MSRKGYGRTGGYYGRFGTKSRRSSKAPEAKFLDTYCGFQFDAVAEVPATGQLCLIPQNTTENGRIGRKVLLKSIQWKTQISMLATGIRDSVNWYIVQDTQCNGAAAAYTDVFDQFSGASVAGLGMRNMANSARFKILYHAEHILVSQAGTTGAFTGDTHVDNGYLKCNIPLEFAPGMGGGITDLKSNNIFLIAGDTLLQDDVTAFSGTFRLRYTDI